MKIIADENIPLIHEFFSSLGDVNTMPARAITQEHVRDADLLIVRSVVPIGRELLEGSSVRFVGTCTAGTDHLDTDYFHEAGIAWSSAPGCNANSVGDYVFSALAALNIDFVRLQVGIIGCGNVGSRLLRRMLALGVDCRCYDPFLDNPELRLGSLEEVLASDIVCVHAPLTRSGPHPSFHLLGKAELQQLKPGAVLISAGRGAVVDNEALSELLSQRNDLRIVLDVWESEPDVNRELFKQVNFGTPHIAGHSYDGKARGTEIVYQKACEFLGQQASISFEELDRFRPSEAICLKSNDLPAALHEAILAVYDLREDHQRFAAALAGDESPRQAFDRLRKNYPIRRELSTYRVKLERDDDILAPQLRALGFRVEVMR